MAQKPLSKGELFELITPVIDGEVTPEKKRAFLIYIQKYPDVRQQFQSARAIKKLVQTRCPKVKAPLPLCNRIHTLISEYDITD